MAAIAARLTSRMVASEGTVTLTLEPSSAWASSTSTSLTASTTGCCCGGSAISPTSSFGMRSSCACSSVRRVWSDSREGRWPALLAGAARKRSSALAAPVGSMAARVCFRAPTVLELITFRGTVKPSAWSMVTVMSSSRGSSAGGAGAGAGAGCEGFGGSGAGGGAAASFFARLRPMDRNSLRAPSGSSPETDVKVLPDLFTSFTSLSFDSPRAAMTALLTSSTVQSLMTCTVSWLSISGIACFTVTSTSVAAGLGGSAGFAGAGLAFGFGGSGWCCGCACSLGLSSWKVYTGSGL
mmetsp:Transcript_53250/g.170600  ORF Transcript_53250/g.170600 Transcript_53250/m.170600 type:complete len:296 (-) Transcript_53250:585-1472(-)